MPLRDIPAVRSWMKRTGSWFSDVWAYLSNIQYLMEQQAQVQTLLASIPAAITRIRFYTVSMPIANRQYSFALPVGTTSIEVQITSREAFRISYCFVNSKTFLLSSGLTPETRIAATPAFLERSITLGISPLNLS